MATKTPVADTCKYKFVRKLDEGLKCRYCQVLAEEPQQHKNEKCAALFCKKCLDRHGWDTDCPDGHSCDASPQYYPDAISKKDILDLRVECNNEDGMCKWEGCLGELNQHSEECQFALLPCPNECEDQCKQVNCFMRKDLDEHLERDCPERDHTCEYCGEKGTYGVIMDSHDKECPEKLLPCPNDGCSEKIKRKYLQDHANSICEHVFITCKYIAIGCEKGVKKKDKMAHELDCEAHLEMALKTISILREKSITLRNGEPMKFKLVDYQNKKTFADSPSYYISPNGYCMAIRVYANGEGSGKGTHVSVYTPILKGRHDAKLRWPFNGKITFTLLNQLGDYNHYQMTVNVEHTYNVRAGGTAWGKPRFICHSELGLNSVENTDYLKDYDSNKSMKYLKDDTLYFRVSVEVADHKPRPWLE